MEVQGQALGSAAKSLLHALGLEAPEGRAASARLAAALRAQMAANAPFLSGAPALSSPAVQEQQPSRAAREAQEKQVSEGSASNPPAKPRLCLALEPRASTPALAPTHPCQCALLRPWRLSRPRGSRGLAGERVVQILGADHLLPLRFSLTPRRRRLLRAEG